MRAWQGTAALRDFDQAYVRSGSFSSDRYACQPGGMSALTRSRPKFGTAASRRDVRKADSCSASKLAALGWCRGVMTTWRAKAGAAARACPNSL
jgi:hypothetical protein